MRIITEIMASLSSFLLCGSSQMTPPRPSGAVSMFTQNCPFTQQKDVAPCPSNLALCRLGFSIN
jgi:hypothetical protein